MKVVIIEDEPLTAKNLARVLRQLEPQAEIIETIDSVAGAVKWLKTNPHPDLFIMDIQLADGVSFDIFNQVVIDKPVIFSTAYNEYAIHAFKVNSIDYLLKPLDKEQLQKALEKFKKYFSAPQPKPVENWQKFADDYTHQQLPKYKERFLAHYKGSIVPIPTIKAAYFLKDTVIYLITTDGDKLITDYGTIDEIEEVVSPALFFRANRQMLIHIEQVDNYKKHDTGKIEVHLKCAPAMRVDVSREKANEFVQWLSE
ncbi:MAG: response regulator transcription factor [Chitinophagales bacterium]|nr:response regulator transcription factor [Chitinophagales bacterium]